MNLSIEVWMQAVAIGLTIGSSYILMALGLALILSIMGILQLAHGEIYMIGAYIAFYLATVFRLNIYLAMPISMLVMALVGIALEKFLFRPVREMLLQPIVISTSLTLILTSLAVVGFGLYQRSLPPLAFGSLEIFGIVIPKDRVIAIAFAYGLVLILYLFLRRTRYGRAMVASAQNYEGALLRGISSNLMSSLAMAIGFALAAVAGTLTGSILTVNPFMGTSPLIKGMIIIVLGGMGSIPGAIVGGLLLGLIDSVVPVVFSSEIAALAPIIVVIIVILVRPRGLFGHE